MSSQKRKHPRAKDRSKTLWDYLNSPFIILLLSSVVVTGITFLVHSLYAASQNRRLAEEKRLALALEISIRYNDFLKNCKGVEEAPSWECYRRLWEDFAMLAEPNYKYKLMQFKDAGMDELVYEMEALDAPKAKQLDVALNTIEDTLEAYYPDTDEHRKSLYSNLEEIVQKRVTDTLAADVNFQVVDVKQSIK